MYVNIYPLGSRGAQKSNKTFDCERRGYSEDSIWAIHGFSVNEKRSESTEWDSGIAGHICISLFYNYAVVSACSPFSANRLKVDFHFAGNVKPFNDKNISGFSPMIIRLSVVFLILFLPKWALISQHAPNSKLNLSFSLRKSCRWKGTQNCMWLSCRFRGPPILSILSIKYSHIWDSFPYSMDHRYRNRCCSNIFSRIKVRNATTSRRLRSGV